MDANATTAFYLGLNDAAKRAIERSTADPGELGRAQDKIHDLSRWRESLIERPDNIVFQHALNEATVGLFLLTSGLYRPAFVSLRLFLELSLASVHFSTNRLELAEWLNGGRDVKWASLADGEQGVLSVRYADAFFPDLRDSVRTYNTIASKIYRELSEFVHGNHKTWGVTTDQIEFNEDAHARWLSNFADASTTVVYALCLRFLKELRQIGSERHLHRSAQLRRTRRTDSKLLGRSEGVKQVPQDAIHEFKIRTEDFRLEEIEAQFVATDQDRETVARLKAAIPVILEGSRGTGKSFLMRVAEVELNRAFQQDRVLPVYLSFHRSSLIHTSDRKQFHHWMLAHLCSAILKAFRQKGLLMPTSPPFAVLAGGAVSADGSRDSRLEQLVKQYENSYRDPGVNVAPNEVPDVERFKDAVEEICREKGITRLCVLFDEAIHILRPEQQRQFFTLFRDLRSPYIGCNAAVYPGVTSYGDVFELSHDASHRRINRDVTSKQYLEQMREIALKQADSSLATAIEKNGQNFAVLAYAVSGNPRLLLKTLAQCTKLRASDVNETIKTFYRSAIWAEHSGLAGSYSGHTRFIDWGRNFIETFVLPETKSKNDRRQSEGQNESTSYFWIHRDTPEVVRHALRLLEYTGIVQKGDDGIRGTRSEIGTRYAVNLGCLLALESTPTASGLDIVRTLSLKRFTEFGANHTAYQSLIGSAPDYREPDILQILTEQLAKSVDCLDITQYQNGKLKEVGLSTVGDVLRATEQHLIERIDYVGEKRARRIKNAADAAVLEYLSG